MGEMLVHVEEHPQSMRLVVLRILYQFRALQEILR